MEGNGGTDSAGGVSMDTSAETNGGGQTPSSEDAHLKYWAAVRANPLDFVSWTALLQLVDQKGDLASVRAAYDGFLGEFPLCYVYWKRYADHEAASTNSALGRVVEIYERAVQAFPNSVDLWTYYTSYLVDKAVDAVHIRSVFERAADKVGTDYLAQSMWDKYLEYELEQKELVNVTRLFTRILSLPIEALPKYYERWKTFITAHPIDDIMTPEESLHLRNEEEETKKEKFSSSREQLYQAAQQELSNIQPYESILKERPYFHIKPVSDELLDTWHRYLTVRQAEGDVSKTIKLYERCLVPCCNYIVYWRRYARFAEDASGIEGAIRVWELATGRLLRRRPDPYLDLALLQESHGQLDAARDIYRIVLSFAPGHVETALRYFQLEQRQRNFEAAISVIEAAIENSKSDSVGGFLTIHYARFIDRFYHDVERTRGVYARALVRYPSNKDLWQAAIDFEINQSGRNTNEADEYTLHRAVSLYQQATSDTSLLSEDDRLELWQNYIDTLHMLAPRAEIVRQALAAFIKACPSGKLKSKKRRHDEETDSSGKKSTRVAGSSSTAATASAPATYNYYGAYGAYGAYPQAAAYSTWPQSAAYSAGTTQQSYTGYSGYAGGYSTASSS